MMKNDVVIVYILVQKKAKMANIVSTGQKWARVEKEYLHYDWTSDTKIWMEGGKGGDISARKKIFLTRLYTITTSFFII